MRPVTHSHTNPCIRIQYVRLITPSNHEQTFSKFVQQFFIFLKLHIQGLPYYISHNQTVFRVPLLYLIALLDFANDFDRITLHCSLAWQQIMVRYHRYHISIENGISLIRLTKYWNL